VLRQLGYPPLQKQTVYRIKEPACQPQASRRGLSSGRIQGARGRCREFGAFKNGTGTFAFRATAKKRLYDSHFGLDKTTLFEIR
jgi:hypothetical protein